MSIMHDLQSIQLDIDLPEIGGLQGDWLCAHPRKGLVLMRQLGPEQVTQFRSHLLRLLNLLDREESAGPPLGIVQ